MKNSKYAILGKSSNHPVEFFCSYRIQAIARTQQRSLILKHTLFSESCVLVQVLIFFPSLPGALYCHESEKHREKKFSIFHFLVYTRKPQENSTDIKGLNQSLHNLTLHSHSNREQYQMSYIIWCKPNKSLSEMYCREA